MRQAVFAGVLLTSAFLIGCGGDVPRGRIHGVVSHQGKPLNHATVIFVGSDNKTHPVKLKADGSFDVDGVAQGKVKVSVQPDLPAVASRPDPRTTPAARLAKGNVIDEKAKAMPQEEKPKMPVADTKPRINPQYADPEKSGLSFELKSADMEWTTDLK